MSEPAQTLGFSANQLREELQSGGTLSSLASEHRVSSSALISRIESDLAATAPKDDAARAGELTEIATRVPSRAPRSSESAEASASGSPAGTRPDHGAVFLSGPTSVRAQSNLASLADTLGTDPGTLLAQLGSGRNLSSLVSSSGDTGYGTPQLPPNAGGILVDQYA